MKLQMSTSIYGIPLHSLSLSLSLSRSNSSSFFLCFVVICLALWSQPGSGPRISPQRHNYHTGLNVPPTICSTHQRSSILSPNLFPSDAFALSLSIIRIFYSPTLPVCSPSIPLLLRLFRALLLRRAANDVRKERELSLFFFKGPAQPKNTISPSSPHPARWWKVEKRFQSWSFTATWSEHSSEQLKQMRTCFKTWKNNNKKDITENIEWLHTAWMLW